MMRCSMTGSSVLQNLKDAGCDSEFTKHFLECGKRGDFMEQMKLLDGWRKHLLDGVHQEERKISCLDYLVYQMKREKGKDATV